MIMKCGATEEAKSDERESDEWKNRTKKKTKDHSNIPLRMRTMTIRIQWQIWTNWGNDMDGKMYEQRGCFVSPSSDGWSGDDKERTSTTTILAAKVRKLGNK